MSENTTRLFHLDTGFDPNQSENHTGPILLPNKREELFLEDEVLVSPLAKPFAMRPSIDSRLREVLKPVIHDINILKPENFYALSESTYEAIVQETRNEMADEAKEALVALSQLLKENFELVSLFNQCINRIHKA